MKACLMPSNTPWNLAIVAKLMKCWSPILLLDLDDPVGALLLATYLHFTSSAMEPTCVALERMGKDCCIF